MVQYEMSQYEIKAVYLALLAALEGELTGIMETISQLGDVRGHLKPAPDGDDYYAALSSAIRTGLRHAYAGIVEARLIAASDALDDGLHGSLVTRHLDEARKYMGS